MAAVDFCLMEPLLELLDDALAVATKGAVGLFVLVRSKPLQIVHCCVELRFSELVDVDFACGFAFRFKDVEVLSGDLAERSKGVDLPCKVCKDEFAC